MKLLTFKIRVLQVHSVFYLYDMSLCKTSKVRNNPTEQPFY